MICETLPVIVILSISPFLVVVSFAFADYLSSIYEVPINLSTPHPYKLLLSAGSARKDEETHERLNERVSEH